MAAGVVAVTLMVYLPSAALVMVLRKVPVVKRIVG
jgi:hypothetical protein